MAVHNETLELCSATGNAEDDLYRILTDGGADKPIHCETVMNAPILRCSSRIQEQPERERFNSGKPKCMSRIAIWRRAYNKLKNQRPDKLKIELSEAEDLNEERRRFAHQLRKSALQLMGNIRMMHHAILHKSPLSPFVSSKHYEMFKILRKEESKKGSKPSFVQKQESLNNLSNIDTGDEELFHGKPKSMTANAIECRRKSRREKHLITHLEASVLHLTRENEACKLKVQLLKETVRVLRDDMKLMRCTVETSGLADLVAPVSSNGDFIRRENGQIKTVSAYDGAPSTKKLKLDFSENHDQGKK